MNGLSKKSWYRIPEIAVFLDTDEFTIRRWIDHGKIKAHKLPGGIKISRETIEKLIEDSEIKPFE